MCGIAGIIGKRSLSIEPLAALYVMKKAINHRGPDDHGSYAYGNSAFLNVRLSIVDVAGGKQPIFGRNGSTGIVYNGEIYNYLELREDLAAKGRVFATSCDTEVVLALFEEYGTEAFRRLNGMFSLCIWDEAEDRIVLARDRFGTKPLYIYEDSEKILFSSELKALLALPGLDLSLDPHGLEDYLTYRYIQSPLTLFRRIRRLEAGSYLVIEGGRTRQQRYWSAEYSDAYPALDEGETKERLEELLLRSVRSQLMGEVPIAVLLSGGVDSSTIAYMVQRLGANLSTYSIGFPDLNEFEYSNLIASRLGFKHIEVVTTPQELLRDLDEIVLALDEPIADPACFPLYRLSKELARHVTVVLSGEGGDELFAGYPQYAATLDGSAGRSSNKRFDEFFARSYYFPDAPGLLRSLPEGNRSLRNRKHFQQGSLLNCMLSYDMHTWMPENLMMKADKIMMAHSLEGRFPFLDNDLFDFAAVLPESYKIRPGTGKWILKEMIAGKLPREIIDRPKMGFSVPVAGLLADSREKVQAAIGSALRGGLGELLSGSRVRGLVADYFERGEGSALQIWTIFILSHWYVQALPRYRFLPDSPHEMAAAAQA